MRKSYLSKLLGMVGVLLAAAVLLAATNQAARAAEEGGGPVLALSSKTATQSQVAAGDMVNYTVVLSNTGDTPTLLNVTDTLPAELTLISVSASEGIANSSGNTITGSWAVNAGTEVIIQYTAEVTSAAVTGSFITNTVEIMGTGANITRSASVEVVDAPPPGDPTIYLPYIAKALPPLPALILSSNRPNSANSWTLSWTGDTAGVTAYELQESHTADFAAVATLSPGNSTSQPVTKVASPFNAYFYRVRAVDGNRTGPWSNVVKVNGAYFDDFTDNTSNWKLRRTTYLEKVFSYYENAQNGYNDRSVLVIKAEDSWDWGLASPLAEAPQPPYVIEYRMDVANIGNLVSAGPVFGGDWNGVPEPAGCIDYSTYNSIYAHTDCFNHFYFINTIWFGSVAMKTAFERVDELIWCPSCGGSPMKRFGDINPDNPYILVNVEPDNYNTYRIEVREDGIKFYANGTYQYTYPDTRHITSPYFGVMATADEYSNSTWVFDYYSVTPLDN